jgi:hypothetical protein
MYSIDYFHIKMDFVIHMSVDRLHSSLKGEQLPLSPYFVCPVGDQDKPWGSHVCCSTCVVDLKSLDKWNKTCYAIFCFWGLKGN